MLEYIKRNYDCLRREIDEAVAKRGGGEVDLVAVTKSGSDEELIALVLAGATDIGENRYTTPPTTAIAIRTSKKSTKLNPLFFFFDLTFIAVPVVVFEILLIILYRLS